MKSITYTHKKGEPAHLDDIYDYQALAGGDWWESIEDDGDDLIITKDIKIKISWVKGD